MNEKLVECIFKLGQLNDNLCLVAYGIGSNKKFSSDSIKAALLVINEYIEKEINKMLDKKISNL